MIDSVKDGEMLRTFNMGVGFVLVVDSAMKKDAIKQVKKFYNCYEIGNIISGEDKVKFSG